MTAKLQLPGLPAINIVSDAEAEECGAVVCVLATDPTPFTDNQFAPCAWCGTLIQHRPHVPKKPPKVCLGCIEGRLGAH